MPIHPFSEIMKKVRDEYFSKLRRLNLFVKHPGEIGRLHEDILRNTLKNYTPRSFEVNTGFIKIDGKDTISKQVDILIWDAQHYAPLLREDEFVVTRDEAAVVAIEVKTELTSDGVKEYLLSTNEFKKELKPETAGHTQFILFGYEGLDYKTIKQSIESLSLMPSAALPLMIINLQKYILVLNGSKGGYQLIQRGNSPDAKGALAFMMACINNILSKHMNKIKQSDFALDTDAQIAAMFDFTGSNKADDLIKPGSGMHSQLK